MFSLKNSLAKEKTAVAFLLKLLFLLCALKLGFLLFNNRIADGWAIHRFADFLPIIKWSLLYDALCIVLINVLLFLIVFYTGKLFQNKVFRLTTVIVFTIANTGVIFLNTIDIFYFRFHLQRADADLLYVLRNPFSNGTYNVLLILLIVLVFCALVGWLIYSSITMITNARAKDNRFKLTNSLLIFFLAIFFISGSKKILPNYPLTAIKAVQLPLTQNSLHTFIYSLYRKAEEAIPDKTYMTSSQQYSLFSLIKKNDSTTARPKNIVLFIMESVPMEFFDSSSAYKVAMPFLDSLVKKSIFFNNAFSYSYSSNKGIVAILAGIPTITDIPLYHTGFTSIKRTSVGNALANNNYSSAFFIGDNYDDFGFAKCCNWLGIQQYYCMEDIPGYRQMEKHTMGLQDEYVLNFMQQKLANLKQPFFATQYNISTHYPNDIASTFRNNYPKQNVTAPMKSMEYYNDCLAAFFKTASMQPWYNNTVFIFCSDHWAQPHTKTIKIDEVESFRIPLFIYEPSNEKKVLNSSIVSQLDIVNTILFYGGYKDSMISYGNCLIDTISHYNRAVFTKTNTSIYQAINNEYVVGFDAIEGKKIYCYNYKKDPSKLVNLFEQAGFSRADSLLLQLKAFLQTASKHYKMKTKNK